LDPTIKLWKERNQWIHDPTAPCKCQSYNPNIDRTTCPNKRQGGTCRKEILRDVFFPFIDQCQADNCPSLRELGRWIYWEKEEGETQFRRQRLHQFITHELGGAVDTLAAKNFWATYVIPEEWKPVMELCQDRKD
jgi:hypothetical protein